MIVARAIGASEVQIGRKRITKSTEMVLAVAVYLCARAGERLTRGEVIDVFWPGGDLAKGRHSLRQMLYKLRLKGFTLDEDGECMHLDVARVDCDVTRALDERWPETVEPWIIEDSGEFLPGVTRQISPQFQDWLEATRGRLAAQYRRAALRQIAQARREGRWADLERWGRVVLRTDPLNEEATLARAESAAMAGSKAAALEILDQYMEELGERSGQIALPATVLRRRISERRPEWGGRGVKEVALVGREALMRRLTTAVSNAGLGRGGAIILIGAPGIGKTRLSSEIREFALISGFRSCSVRATRSDAGRPLSLATAIASAVQDLPGVAGTSPAALALLSRLCKPSAQPQATDIAAIETISARETAWALADAIAAATHEHRLFISIDDVHNADALSLEVLTSLARASHSQRLLVLATSRLTSVYKQHSFGSPFSDFTVVPVPPLSHADAAVLVSSFAAPLRKQISSQASDAILRAGGGNPLFLRELTSHRSSQPSLASLPLSLVEVIEQRIGSFSQPELRLLRLLSLLGPLACFWRIRALLPTTEWDYDSFLEQLELEGVLSLSPTGALELHECWHDSVRDSLKGTALSAMSFDAAVLLSSEASTDAGFTNYWRAAELFSSAGSTERSLEEFRRVANLFSARGLAQQAVEALSQAAALSSDARSRAGILSELAYAQNAAAHYADAAASCDAALKCTPDAASESATIRVEVLSTLVDSRLKLGLPIRDAINALALAVASTSISDAVCQRACHVASRSLFNSGATEVAQPFLALSTTSTERFGKSLMGSIVKLMHAAELGDAEELDSVEREVAEGSADADSPSTRMLALRYRATALRFLARPLAAAKLMEQAVEVAKTFGAPRDARLAAQSLVFLHLDHSEYDQARRWLQEAERLAAPAQGVDVDHALVHAKARYFLEIGDPKTCLETYDAHMDMIRDDTVPRRRAADQACLCLAFSQVGNASAARRACSETMSLLDTLNPGLTEDWVADSLLKSLAVLGADDVAREVRASYLRRRSSLCNRPMPSAFSSLSAAP